jgi:hypothetical protein
MQRSERLVREVYSVTLLQTPLSAGVADIVNAYAEDAGSDPAAGLLTSAAKSGASIFQMMDVSRRSSVEILLFSCLAAFVTGIVVAAASRTLVIVASIMLMCWS